MARKLGTVPGEDERENEMMLSKGRHLELGKVLPNSAMATEELVAADKVALIVSNRTYAPQMTNLITPHCDAETLADALQQLKFKTVTLGDLNLAEMNPSVSEYRKLLGEGV